MDDRKKPVKGPNNIEKEWRKVNNLPEEKNIIRGRRNEGAVINLKRNSCGSHSTLLRWSETVD